MDHPVRSRGAAYAWLRVTIPYFVLCQIVTAHHQKPCSPEPTDMTIGYRDVLRGPNCELSPSGDTDSFRFSGVQGQTVAVQVTRTEGGGLPCFALFDPDGGRSDSCWSGAPWIARREHNLAKTGTYEIRIYSSGQTPGGTFSYELNLYLLDPPTATEIRFQQTLGGEIVHSGDIGIYVFNVQPSPGDLISIQVGARRSGAGLPCIALFDPDKIRLTPDACYSGAPWLARFEHKPTKAGTYTAWVYVSGLRPGATMTFDIFLQCVGRCQIPCSFSISPTSGGTSSAGDTLTVDVSASAGCSWTAASNVPWAQVYPLSGTAPAQVRYTIFPSFSSSPRLAILTVANQLFMVTQAANTLSLNERFVELLYFNFFGRLPSATEREAQVTYLLRTPATWAELAKNFFDSSEFNNGGRFVAGLYVGLLDRNAEYGGWLFQRNALARGLVTQDSLVENFLNSAEYAAKFPNASNAEFVRLLYRYVLLREPSQAEVNFHVGNINQGQLRTALARNFLNSAEFRSGTGPRLIAFLLYATFLLRDPNPADRMLRENQIRSGVSLSALVTEFLNLPEFRGILD
jgi:hypothetical protein